MLSFQLDQVTGSPVLICTVHSSVWLQKKVLNTTPTGFKKMVAGTVYTQIYLYGWTVSVLLFKLLSLENGCEELLLPLVWSEEGPVIKVGVEPLCHVQSKLSVRSWFHEQRLLSKLQARSQTVGDLKHSC